MPLETGSYIGDLVTTNPASSDAVGAGDDHLRLIKSTLKATFPFMGGPAWRQRVVAASTTITATTENMTHFVTTNNVNLNLPDGATAGDGWMGVIFPVAAGTTVHLVPAGVNTINAATATASVQYGTIGLLFGTGGAWYLHKVPRYEGNALYLPSGATISGTVVMTTGPLIVQGPATISALAVTAGMRNDGPTTLSGSVQMLTSLNVQGPTTLSGVTSCVGKITCAGGADISIATIGAATVTNNLFVGGTASISGNAVVDGGFNVRGTATISGAVLLATTLNVNGAAIYESSLNVRGTTTLSGAVLMATTFNCVGDAIFDASLNVRGTTTLSGAVLIASTLNVVGSISSGGHLVYTRGNLVGTVSQSGGTPTGAVVERGSNANGTYVRFADGTQICEHAIAWADINTATASGVFATTGTLSWTFPAAFATTPAFTTATPANFGGTWGGAGSTTNSTTGVYTGFSNTSYTGAFNMNVFATGRWF